MQTSGSVWGAACDTRVEKGFQNLTLGVDSQVNAIIGSLNTACRTGDTKTFTSAYQNALSALQSYPPTDLYTQSVIASAITQLENEAKQATVTLNIPNFGVTGWQHTCQETLWDLVNNTYPRVSSEQQRIALQNNPERITSCEPCATNPFSPMG